MAEARTGEGCDGVTSRRTASLKKQRREHESAESIRWQRMRASSRVGPSDIDTDPEGLSVRRGRRHGRRLGRDDQGRNGSLRRRVGRRGRVE